MKDIIYSTLKYVVNNKISLVNTGVCASVKNFKSPDNPQFDGMNVYRIHVSYLFPVWLISNEDFNYVLSKVITEIAYDRDAKFSLFSYDPYSMWFTFY